MDSLKKAVTCESFNKNFFSMIFFLIVLAVGFGAGYKFLDMQIKKKMKKAKKGK